LTVPSGRRLYRSRKDRILGGVCGGLGEYLNVDPNLIRLLWIFLTFFYGIAVLVYVAAWILLPEEPLEAEVDVQPAPPRPVNWPLLIGAVLVALGAMALLESLRLIPIRHSGSLALIIVGVILVLIALSRREEA